MRTANPDKPGDVSFTGLRKMLDSRRAVRLLVIHGMGTHPTTYANDFLEKLRTELVLEPSEPCVTVDKMANAYGVESVVQRCVYATGERRLHVYVLTWSKLTEYFEKQFLEPDWMVYGGDRVKVNRALKENLIDTGFSDAMMYVGTFGPSMQASVERAICVLLTDKTALDSTCDIKNAISWNPDHTKGQISTGASPIVLASHSLGSMMVLETVGKMLCRGPAPESLDAISSDDEPTATAAGARAFLDDLGLVALLANQLPLLYLARVPEKPAPPSCMLLSRYLARRPAQIPFVSFNDPNDLLTFPIPKDWRERIAPTAGDRLKIVNVRVTNARYRWLGVAVNPGKAHTGYWTNGAVIDYLARGR